MCAFLYAPLRRGFSFDSLARRAYIRSNPGREKIFHYQIVIVRGAMETNGNGSKLRPFCAINNEVAYEKIALSL